MDIFLLVTGTLLLIYVIIVTFSLGAVPFNTVLFILGALMIIFGVLDLKFFCISKIFKLKKVLIFVIILLLSVFGVLEFLVISGATDKNKDEADYVVVLGAGLRGEEISLTLKQRLDATLEIFKGETVIVTGGQGYNETIPEAVAMKKYLVENGLSEEKIILEDKSENTKENLDNAKNIIKEHSGKELSDVKVKIITSDYHCYRAKMLAERQGYFNISSYGARSHPLLVPSHYIREALALAKSFILDK